MENTCGTTGEQFRRIAERDWRDGRDEGGFEVRSSRFSELRTPNFELRISPFSHVSHVTPHRLWRWRTFSAFCYPSRTQIIEVTCGTIEELRCGTGFCAAGPVGRLDPV